MVSWILSRTYFQLKSKGCNGWQSGRRPDGNFRSSADLLRLKPNDRFAPQFSNWTAFFQLLKSARPRDSHSNKAVSRHWTNASSARVHTSPIDRRSPPFWVSTTHELQARRLAAKVIACFCAVRRVHTRRSSLVVMALVSASLFVSSAASTSAAGTDACKLKGNVSTRGERIYHVPGQKYYNATRISASRGARWFCSEEARAAGWRRSRV